MNANFTINGKIIETERLILRAFKPEDLNDFFQYAKVAGVGEMAGWPHHENIEATKEILDMFIKEDKTFALVLKENNKVIGSLGIEKYGREEDLTEFDGYLGRELGFVLSKDYWGKGLVCEAVNGIINYLFNELNYDFLICCHFDFNTQSKRVQEKCGFKPYRKVIYKDFKQQEILGFMNLLVNPNKNIKFNFSHPETLI